MLQDLKNLRVADVEAYEERIREAISAGYIISAVIIPNIDAHLYTIHITTCVVA